jgi:hypothetical protein
VAWRQELAELFSVLNFNGATFPLEHFSEIALVRSLDGEEKLWDRRESLSYNAIRPS